MNAVGVLTREGGDEIDELVRLVAAARVGMRSVNDFLQHEMPAHVGGEVGGLEKSAEIVEVAVQVATDEDVGGVEQGHEAAAAARLGAKSGGGSPERGQEASGSGMTKR